MHPLLINPKPTDEEAIKLHLYQQIQVGKTLQDNPIILEYIEKQVAMLVSEVVAKYQGHPEEIKDYVVKRNVQIATYKHLHELATECEKNLKEYTLLSVNQTPEDNV